MSSTSRLFARRVALVLFWPLLLVWAVWVLHAVGAIAWAQELTVVQVLRVIDGDTVDVDLDGARTRLRLIGMDTPETVAPGQPVECFGREASAYAHELLDGQWVAIELDPTQGRTDRFGRTLAYVWLPDGRNFGEVMIRDGYAHEYTFSRRYSYSAEFKAAELAARADQVGLWSACAA